MCQGWSALMLASNAGYTDIVTMLLAQPDIDISLMDEVSGALLRIVCSYEN